jgi:hypothetical protein
MLAAVARRVRLDLLDRTAAFAPSLEAAAHMRHRRKPHLLGDLRGERGAPGAGAIEQKQRVALKDRLGASAASIVSITPLASASIAL